MIGRIHDRATFDALSARGRRVRSGPVGLVFVPGEDTAQVAYAIGRKVGNAVKRNRLRRRLREIMRDLSRSDEGLPPGAYLILTRPGAGDLPYQELARRIQLLSRKVHS